MNAANGSKRELSSSESCLVFEDGFPPCKEIRKVGPYYGITFEELEKSVAENLTEILDRFMNKAPLFLASVGR